MPSHAGHVRPADPYLRYIQRPSEDAKRAVTGQTTFMIHIGCGKRNSSAAIAAAQASQAKGIAAGQAGHPREGCAKPLASAW